MRSTLAVTVVGFALFAFATPRTWAQEFLWAKQLGGTASDFAFSVALDAGGNVYSVGSFFGTADFDSGPGTFNLTAAGNTDAFVSKLDSNGNFLWAKQLGGASTETTTDAARGVTLDAGGNIYSVGSFDLTADFDPGPGTFNLTSAGVSDGFVSKLDSNGNFLWAKQLGGTASDGASGVALDAGGNVYSVGTFVGTADFDPGPGTFNLTSAGFLDAFVSKLDSNGNFLWAKRLGGTLSDDAVSVVLDAGGNVYSVGSFYGTVDFDPGPGTFNLTSAGDSDAFVSKLDSNGNFLWAKQLGGTSTEHARGVTLDAGGNVYSVGSFDLTADFDPGPSTFNLTSAGSSDAFVSKLDSNGNFLWANPVGTSSDVASGVALDAGGNVYSVGSFVGNAVEAFVSKLDSNGNFLWAKRLDGTSNDFARGVALDAGGNVYTVGSFVGRADFDPGPGTFNLTSAGGSDGFVFKLGGIAAGDMPDTLQVQHGAGGDITLSWGNSCAITDDDFAIYEGAIGTWDSHVARLCGTGGATTATITPASGNSYYLVVPRNALREGSYGTASNGTPRPQGAPACAVQQIAQPCP